MTQIKNIIKFKFGHKEIQFPRKVLIYYRYIVMQRANAMLV